MVFRSSRFFLILVVLLVGAVFCSYAAPQIVIGLVVKSTANPYWNSMIISAQKYAAEKGIKLMTAAGAYDGDNAGQVTAMENMASAGAKGILVTPSNSTAIVPTIKKLQEQGVVVICLDSPTVPEDATDGLFATDNKRAGRLIGEYAKVAMAGKTPVIAMMDGVVGAEVSVLRHDGFLEGFGIKEGDPQIVSEQATDGEQPKAQTAMENSLTKAPNINLVYTINEPAAFGVYTALKAAGKEKDVMVVTIDGSRTGIGGAKSGQFAADTQQYPGKMATMGIDAVIKYVQTGVKPSGYVDTGELLITDKPLKGVDSQTTDFGLKNAWGK